MSRIVIKSGNVTKYSSNISSQSVIAGTASTFNPKKKDYVQSVSVASIKDFVLEKGTPFFYRKRFHEMKPKQRLEVFVHEFAYEIMRALNTNHTGYQFEIRLTGEPSKGIPQPSKFDKIYLNSKGSVPMNNLYTVEIHFEESEKDLEELFG